MKRVNNSLVKRLVLVAMMIAILTFFTSCDFTSSNMDLGVSMLGGSVRMIFDSLVNGVLTLVRGVFEGLWTFISGIFHIIYGAVAWVWEFILGLF